MDMSLSKLKEMWRTGKPGVLQFMVSQIVRHDLPTEQQQDYSKKRVGKYKFLISDMKDKIACISHNKINIRDFHKMLHDNKLNILKEKE